MAETPGGGGSSRPAGFVSEPFGEQTPFGDPYWYRTSSTSLYYNKSHHDFRATVREWVEAELMPHW
jgi:hypothetical protein